MDITLGQLAYWVIIPILAWIFKSLVIARIEELERKIELMVTETQVRTIINDKLDPIQQDLKEIKSDLKHLFVLKLNENASNRPDRDSE